MERIRDNGYNRRKAEAVQAVIRGLNAILEPVFVEDYYRPSPIIVEDTQEGFSMDGNYHFKREAV